MMAARLGASYSGRCADCNLALPAPRGAGHPRRYCDRCRDRHSIMTRLHQARRLANGLDAELHERISGALERAIEAFR